VDIIVDNARCDVTEDSIYESSTKTKNGVQGFGSFVRSFTKRKEAIPKAAPQPMSEM
jgi:hypothetical protein